MTCYSDSFQLAHVMLMQSRVCCMSVHQFGPVVVAAGLIIEVAILTKSESMNSIGKFIETFYTWLLKWGGLINEVAAKWGFTVIEFQWFYVK